MSFSPKYCSDGLLEANWMGQRCMLYGIVSLNSTLNNKIIHYLTRWRPVSEEADDVQLDELCPESSAAFSITCEKVHSRLLSWAFILSFILRKNPIQAVSVPFIPVAFENFPRGKTSSSFYLSSLIIFLLISEIKLQVTVYSQYPEVKVTVKSRSHDRKVKVR